MPPEPLPWDRKEWRRHDVGGGGVVGGGFSVGGGGGPRWRELPFPHHHHPYNQNYHHYHHNGHHSGGAPRFFPDFRYRPTGHGKQGGRHLYIEDFGRGFMASRPNDKITDDESCRASGSGRNCRSSRENRASFGQKDWKGHSSEIHPQPNGPLKSNNTGEQRSVDPNPDFVNSRDKSHTKDHRNTNCSVGVVGGTSQKSLGEKAPGSLDWKPLKWTRAGCLSSKGSGLNHSSSSKSIAADSEEAKVEQLQKDVTLAPSPLVDTPAASVAFVAGPEATSSRKKPRLGWGEGLAKFEKKSIDGSYDSLIKDGATTSASDAEAEQSHFSNLSGKSPGIAGHMDCTSPATPSSVTCSSSPGRSEKLLNAAAVDCNRTNLCSSPAALFQNYSVELTSNLENLGLTSTSQLSSSINELLQSNDLSSLDSQFSGVTAMNKLLLWKNGISKTLEATESEIDMLENELKSLISEYGRRYSCEAASISVAAQYDPKPCNGNDAASRVTFEHASPQHFLSRCGTLEEALNTVEDGQGTSKDEGIDSPGSATSTFNELSSTAEDSWHREVLEDGDRLMNLDVDKSGTLACQVHGLNDEKKFGVLTNEVASQLMACNSAISTNNKLQLGGEKDLSTLLLASNRDFANKYSELLFKLLPASKYSFGISRVESSSFLPDGSIKERFLRRKRVLRFKERVTTLKFKIYQHMWREDIQLLSLKKLRTKSLKKFDSSLRALNSGSQKHRSSIRSRYSSGRVTLGVTTEILNYASRLLSDSQVNPYRNILKMPALIFDKHERMTSRFISSNGLVEDPFAVEKERSLNNPWTSKEKEIFMDKLALFGKDFRKIASLLEHKTTADCIEFYYKNHKSYPFAALKKPEFLKQAKSLSTNTYLVASGKRSSREVNAVSLDMLGAASAIAANVDDSLEIQQRCSSKSFSVACSSYRVSRGEDCLLQSSNSLDVSNYERETVAADVLAGICGSLSSEAMSSCITSSVDQEWKYQRVGSSTRRPLTPEVTQDVDDETCSDESCAEMDPADWTDEEKSIFIQSVSSYGKDFLMISRCVRTRSPDQCKVFFSKARKCLGLDTICPGSGDSARDCSNGGGSDRGDACIIETGPTICSGKSGFKVEEAGPSPDTSGKHSPRYAELTNVKSDIERVDEDTEVGDTARNTELMSKNLLPDDRQTEVKPALDFYGNVGSRNGASTQPDSLSAADTSSSGSAVASALQQKTDFELDCTQKSCAAMPQQTDCSAPSKFGPNLSETAKHEISPSYDQAGIELGISDKHVSDGQHLSVQSPLERVEPSCVAKGYSVSTLSMKEIRGGLSCEGLIPFQSIKKSNGVHFGLDAAKDICLQRCNHSRPADPLGEPPHASQDELKDCSRATCGGPLDADKPCSSGNVKLFGQILSKPSQQKPNSSTQRNQNHCSQQQKVDSRSGMKCSSNHPVDEHSVPAKFDSNIFGASENLPFRHFGFWDRNSMPNSPLPDSAMLLSKYPAAFGNYAMPSLKMKKPSLQGVGKNGETVLLSKDILGGNGVADFHMYRNKDVEPFTIDTMPRGSGFEVMQQQSKGIGGIDVVGRGGVVVSGQYTSVSDPVAAIRMHYAKTKALGAEAGTFTREGDSLRAKGNIGR